MDVEHSKALVRFGNLKVTIEGAIDAANGTPDALAKDVEQLLETLIAERFNRMEFGLAASRIRARCKVDLHWMPVRKMLAKYIHRSYSTLDSMINAAVKAARLDDARLAALIGEGIDPTERKYDSLLDDLLGADFSGTVAEARDVVREALGKFRVLLKRVADERRLAKAAAELDNPSRIRRILKDRLRHIPSGKRNEAGLMIFREFANAFEAEFSESMLQFALGQAKAEVREGQNHRGTELTHDAPLGNRTPTGVAESGFDAISAAM